MSASPESSDNPPVTSTTGHTGPDVGVDRDEHASPDTLGEGSGNASHRQTESKLRPVPSDSDIERKLLKDSLLFDQMAWGNNSKEAAAQGVSGHHDNKTSPTADAPGTMPSATGSAPSQLGRQVIPGCSSQQNQDPKEQQVLTASMVSGYIALRGPDTESGPNPLFDWMKTQNHVDNEGNPLGTAGKKDISYLLHHLKTTLHSENMGGDSPRSAVFEMKKVPVHHMKAPAGMNLSDHRTGLVASHPSHFDWEGDKDDDEGAEPSGRISPCTFLAFAEGCKRWDANEKDPEGILKNAVRTRPEGPGVDKDRYPYYIARATTQLDENTREEISPYYIVPRSPSLIYTPPGVTENAPYTSAHFFDMLKRTAPMEAKKKDEHYYGRVGSVPAAGTNEHYTKSEVKEAFDTARSSDPNPGPPTDLEELFAEQYRAFEAEETKSKEIQAHVKAQKELIKKLEYQEEKMQGYIPFLHQYRTIHAQIMDRHRKRQKEEELHAKQKLADKERARIEQEQNKKKPEGEERAARQARIRGHVEVHMLESQKRLEALRRQVGEDEGKRQANERVIKRLQDQIDKGCRELGMDNFQSVKDEVEGHGDPTISASMRSGYSKMAEQRMMLNQGSDQDYAPYRGQRTGGPHSPFDTETVAGPSRPSGGVGTFHDNSRAGLGGNAGSSAHHGPTPAYTAAPSALSPVLSNASTYGDSSRASFESSAGSSAQAGPAQAHVATRSTFDNISLVGSNAAIHGSDADSSVASPFTGPSGRNYHTGHAGPVGPAGPAGPTGRAGHNDPPYGSGLPTPSQPRQQGPYFEWGQDFYVEGNMPTFPPPPNPFSPPLDEPQDWGFNHPPPPAPTSRATGPFVNPSDSSQTTITPAIFAAEQARANSRQTTAPSTGSTRVRNPSQGSRAGHADPGVEEGIPTTHADPGINQDTHNAYANPSIDQGTHTAYADPSTDQGTNTAQADAGIDQGTDTSAAAPGIPILSSRAMRGESSFTASESSFRARQAQRRTAILDLDGDIPGDIPGELRGGGLPSYYSSHYRGYTVDSSPAPSQYGDSPPQ
ncbi:hypothetical protein GGR54DRAFT_646001 [Hypoxylon sp. NC1633]|nr:hypothetical protein GGR54DRAFT_646001 [Hypoxylon sp. NC1633]